MLRKVFSRQVTALSFAGITSIVLAGAAGYAFEDHSFTRTSESPRISQKDPVALHGTPGVSVHAATDPVRTELHASIKNSSDGDGLQVDVEFVNTTPDQIATAVATVVYDDAEQEWIPESIQRGPQLFSENKGQHTIALPTGFPDGYYRLEVTTGIATPDDDFVRTRTFNEYFSVFQGTLSLMNANDWLVDSQAMMRLPAPVNSTAEEEESP